MKDIPDYIYGKHAVIEALNIRPDIVRVVYTTKNNVITQEMREVLTKHTIPWKELIPKKLPTGIASDAVYQGYIAEINVSKLIIPYEDFVHSCAVTNDTSYVLLAEIHDPHNVGAIIRSAVAFGVSAVFIPEHRQAQMTGTIIKVSAGTAFHVPLVQIKNINHTLADLKKCGFWIYGLDMHGTQSLQEERFEKPTVMVLGNEAEGIRKKTLEHCDIVLTIPMSVRTESLNVSVAAGIALYAWSLRHVKIL